MVKIETTQIAAGEFIAQRIVKMRKQKGLTQAELAEKVNISAPTLSAFENNTSSVSFEKFCEIAEVCDYEIVANNHSFMLSPIN